MKRKLKIKKVLPLAILFVAALFFMNFSRYTAKGEPRVGDKAPEIVGKTPKGDEIKLSSYRGKIVLIDFWASWCPPCRRENVNVVANYQEFKNKKFKNGDGFVVLSVSLDKNPASWERAIKADKLSWDTNIRDMKDGYSKAAKDYEVRAIPTSFLVDGNGKIIAKKLRSSELREKLMSIQK